MNKASEILAKLIGDFHRDQRKREAEDARANPEKHRLSRVIEGSLNYTYWPAGERSTKRRQFKTKVCVAKHRNVAGVFLIWDQHEEYRLRRGKWSWHQTKRDNWRWSPSKQEAHRIATTRSQRLVAASTS